MSAAAKILDRLQGVKQTAPGRWLARCPAHDDKRPSLSIRDNDGKVLVHDFGGCDVGDVLDSLGLQLCDLFDRPLEHRSVPTRSTIPARDILEVIGFELSVVAIITHDILELRGIGDLGWNRLAIACQRIDSARLYCGGR